MKDYELASLFGKLKYKENLIDSIYETQKEKTLVSATPLSTTFFSTYTVQDFQDSPDDEEDTRSSHEYLNDLEEEYQARALLAKSKDSSKRVLMTSNNVYFIALFIPEYSEEEVTETMAETMEQYMIKTQADYGLGVARPKIEDKDNFELKGQFLKELRDNSFSGSDHEDANENIEKVLEIVDLFHIPNITIDQVMLRAFPMSLTGAASRWLRNKPSVSITTWEDLKTKFRSKYCPLAHTTKKMEEINNFQQELDENLYQA
ncbi:hypothetical protein Tco_0560637 [Tanacetum coccineum]